MALGDGQALVLVDRAQYRHLRIPRDHFTQLALMAWSADLVEDDAGDLHARIERLVAQDQGGDATRHADAIEHQHHRHTQEFGQGGVAVTAFHVHAIVEALVALDQGDVGRRGMTRIQRRDLGLAHHVEIQVVAGPTRREPVPDRIDIVRPLLECLYLQSTIRQGATQPQG